MIIDFHTYIYPDKSAQHILKYIEEEKGVLAYGDGTVASLRQMMKKNHVDLSVVLPIATRLGQNPNLNDYAKSLCGDDLISFGSVFPQDPDWREQIDYAKSLGLPGLKFHPDFQEFFFTEKHIIDIIRYALDQGLIVLLHVGIDPALRELVHSTPQMVRKVIDQVDSRRLVLAHLGGHLYWDEVLQYIAGTDCYIDTALAIGTINLPKMLSIFEKHGYDRILYGSDSPWGSQQVSVGSFSRLMISQDKIEKILYKNAAQLLNILDKNDLRQP